MRAHAHLLLLRSHRRLQLRRCHRRNGEAECFPSLNDRVGKGRNANHERIECGERRHCNTDRAVGIDDGRFERLTTIDGNERHPGVHTDCRRAAHQLDRCCERIRNDGAERDGEVQILAFERGRRSDCLDCGNVEFGCHGDENRRRVGPAFAVADRDHELVRAVVIASRGVGPAAVGIDSHRSVGRIAGLGVRERVAIDVGGLDTPADGCVFGRCRPVVAGERSVRIGARNDTRVWVDDRHAVWAIRHRSGNRQVIYRRDGDRDRGWWRDVAGVVGDREFQVAWIAVEIRCRREDQVLRLGRRQHGVVGDRRAVGLGQ